jgi:hypothetical protein
MSTPSTISPPPHTIAPLTVTVATARKISGLGNTKLWELIRDRKLETVHVGRRTLITFQSLQSLLTPCTSSEPQPSGHKRTLRGANQ